MKYTVLFEYEAGWWNVTVPEIPGCLTQAKTIKQGIERIREAMSLFDADVASAKLHLVYNNSESFLKMIDELEPDILSVRNLQKRGKIV